MKSSIKIGQMMPLGFGVLSFASVGILYVGTVFNTQTRWGMLAVLWAWLLIKSGALAGLKNVVAMAMLANIGWAIATTMWSELPELTTLKAVAMFAVWVGFFLSGNWIACRFPEPNLLRVFAPLAIVVLATAALGSADTASYIESGDRTMYRGLTWNPNLFGELLCMIFPVALYEIYLGKNAILSQRMNILIAVAICGLLLASNSRASLMCAFMIGLGFVWALGMQRLALLMAIALFVVTLIYAAMPEAIDEMLKFYVLKGGESSAELFSSRDALWEMSLAQAAKGAWIGGGLGVMIGDTSFTFGLTALDYGREKGNSLLAVMEELGLVGLMLYLLLLFSILATVLGAALRADSPNRRVFLFVTGGTLAGLIVNSQFEAWWLSPGSPPTPYFWALCGLAVGVAHKKPNRRERDLMKPTYKRGSASPTIAERL